MDAVATQATDLSSMPDRVVPVARSIMSMAMNADGLRISSSIRESGAASKYPVGSQHACGGDHIVQGMTGALSVMEGEHTERFDLEMLGSSDAMRRVDGTKLALGAALQQGAQTKRSSMALPRPSSMRLQVLFAAGIEPPGPSRSSLPVSGRALSSGPCEMMPERAIERAAWAVAQSMHERSDANVDSGSRSAGRTVIRLKFWRKVIGEMQAGNKRSLGDAERHNRFPVGGSTCQPKAVLG